jgi:phosphoribosylformylglycinamidine (FGAM) synthase-like amidotransferase family enzyme
VRIPVAHGEDATSPTPRRSPASSARPSCGATEVVARHRRQSQHVGNDIAGICNAAGTIVGIMPHPSAWSIRSSARPTVSSSCSLAGVRASRESEMIRPSILLVARCLQAPRLRPAPRRRSASA